MAGLLSNWSFSSNDLMISSERKKSKYNIVKYFDMLITYQGPGQNDKG